MKTNALLKEIKSIALEEEALLKGIVSGSYDRLAKNSLSEDERAFLESNAQTDAFASLAFDAFSPLGEDFQEGITDEIVEYLNAGRVRVEIPEPSERKESWIQRLNEMFSFRILVPAVSFCAVVALILPTGINESALPLYTFEMMSSDQVLRSGSDAETRRVSQFSTGSLLDVIVRPQQATSADVQMRTYFVEFGSAREVKLNPKRSDSGAFRIKAIVGEQFPKRSGRYEFLVIVAPKGEFPSNDELSSVAESGQSDPSVVWQVFREPFQLIVGEAMDAK